VIQLSFNGTDKRVELAIREKGPAVRAELNAEMGRMMLELLRRVQQKLSGEVLHVRSGKLLGSAHVEPTVSTATSIVGRVTAAAGPAFYGKFHENGGTRWYDIVPVNKKALAFFPGGSFGAGFGQTGIRQLRFVQGKNRGSLRPGQYDAFAKAGGIVVMKVHHPPLPVRSFMRSSLAELRDRITRQLHAAAARGVRS
jgi:hypothetical protein